MPPPSDTTYTASPAAHPADSGWVNTKAEVSGVSVGVGRTIGAGDGDGVGAGRAMRATPEAPATATTMSSREPAIA
jgi:hypothetical protein